MIKHDGHLRTRGKCRKHEPQASVFYISLWRTLGEKQALLLVYVKQVLICRRLSPGIAWDTVTAYVYIYRRIIIYPSIDRQLASELQASRRLSAVVGDENIEWTSSADPTYSSKTIRSTFTSGKLKIAPIRLAFHANLSTSEIQRRCADDPLGQVAERYQSQTATTS